MKRQTASRPSTASIAIQPLSYIKIDKAKPIRAEIFRTSFLPLAEGSKKAPAIECFFACPGDGNQICGAGNRLTTYALTGTITPQTDTSATYKSIGCYTEATNSRALIGGSADSDSMTVAKCSAKFVGFLMFGLEYGRECSCGDKLAVGSVKVPETDCTFPCSGSSTELCGAGFRLNVYITKEGVAPVVLEVFSTYARKGCYTDSVANRALTEKVIAVDDLSIQKCATNCAGFTWFGVEYGREWFCGNNIGASGHITDDSECNFACSGDATVKCAAGDRLDIYKFEAISQSSSNSVESSSSTSTTTESAASSSTTTATHTTVEPTITSSSTSSSITTTTTVEPTITSSSTTSTMTTTGSTTTTATTTTTTTSTTTSTESIAESTLICNIAGNLITNPSFEEPDVAAPIPGWTQTMTSAQGFFALPQVFPSNAASPNPGSSSGIRSALCGNQVLQYRGAIANPAVTGEKAEIRQVMTGLLPARMYTLVAYVRRALILPTTTCTVITFLSNTDEVAPWTTTRNINGAAWTRVEANFMISSDSLVVRLVMGCVGREDLFVDQVSVQLVPQSIGCTPPPNGNLLGNAGFESPVNSNSIPFWSRGFLYPNTAWDVLDIVPLTPTTEAPLCGFQNLRYSGYNPSTGYQHAPAALVQAVRVVIGKAYNFSLYARRANLNGSNVRCRVGIQILTPNTEIIQYVFTDVESGPYRKYGGVFHANLAIVIVQVTAMCDGRDNLYIDSVVF